MFRRSSPGIWAQTHQTQCSRMMWCSGSHLTSQLYLDGTMPQNNEQAVTGHFFFFCIVFASIVLWYLMCQKNVGLGLSDSPGQRAKIHPLPPQKVRAEMASSLASPRPLKNTGQECPGDLLRSYARCMKTTSAISCSRYLHVCKKEPVKKTEIGGSPPVG